MKGRSRVLYPMCQIFREKLYRHHVWWKKDRVHFSRWDTKHQYLDKKELAETFRNGLPIAFCLLPIVYCFANIRMFRILI